MGDFQWKEGIILGSLSVDWMFIPSLRCLDHARVVKLRWRECMLLLPEQTRGYLPVRRSEHQVYIP
ncbi:hypothetical protein MNBD_GAMMA13-2118 [hydrothermal vent metagenome]|uniref:Uncharacterized protein n=1 Tax=hydrothermal vent metagenome TaxID=652676 RepID=A0A3B0YTK2_9ZZZZ